MNLNNIKNRFRLNMPNKHEDSFIVFVREKRPYAYKRLFNSHVQCPGNKTTTWESNRFGYYLTLRKTIKLIDQQLVYSFPSKFEQTYFYLHASISICRFKQYILNGLIFFGVFSQSSIFL